MNSANSYLFTLITPLHDKRKLLALLCALGKQVRKAINALSVKDAQYLSPPFTQ